MDLSENLLDEACEQIARALAARSTRRSWLGRAAKLVLGALGIELALPAIPVDAQPADPLAPEWQKCGAYGYLCGSDCGTGDDYSCPGGCLPGSFWHACCPRPAGGAVEINYYDCFLQPNGKLPNCTSKTERDKAASCNVPLKRVYRDFWTGEYCCSFINPKSKNAGPAP